MKEKELPIKNTSFNANEFKIIIAGVPIWAGKPTSYLKRVIFVFFLIFL